MIRLKTILHPTDFSEASRYAMEVACALARDQAARLILLHVLPRPTSPASDEKTPTLKTQHSEADLKAYRDEMSGMLDKLRNRASWAQVETMLKDGDVAAVITRTAKETPCDLIVMGSHGRSRMYQLMLGSVAAAVSRQATCPVVTVRIPPNHQVTAE